MAAAAAAAVRRLLHITAVLVQVGGPPLKSRADSVLINDNFLQISVQHFLQEIIP